MQFLENEIFLFLYHSFLVFDNCLFSSGAEEEYQTRVVASSIFTIFDLISHRRLFLIIIDFN